MVKDILQSMLYPKEINAMLKIKLGHSATTPPKAPLEQLATQLNDRDFCYAALTKVSRSFAVVIQQLPEELRDPVCVFYLVLRGLDTVEDDMLFESSKKYALLRVFNEKCYDEQFKLENVGDTHDYRVLMAHFDKVVRVFKSLDRSYQMVIDDICFRMGNGMADFAERKVSSMADYNLYCHYVAGLVGIGLSALFSASKLEDEQLKHQVRIANSMGLMLQKTNIIRDYHEDLQGLRSFWPSDVWSMYAEEYSWFSKNPEHPQSLTCLNHLVTDALRHAQDCLTYLSLIKDPMIFRFCAIPQVMAMATLAKIYNNPNVFTSVVKIRKGLAADMMLHTNSMESVQNAFAKGAREILRKLSVTDRHYLVTKTRAEAILQAVKEKNGYGKLKLDFENSIA